MICQNMHHTLQMTERGAFRSRKYFPTLRLVIGAVYKYNTVWLSMHCKFSMPAPGCNGLLLHRWWCPAWPECVSATWAAPSASWKSSGRRSSKRAWTAPSPAIRTSTSTCFTPRVPSSGCTTETSSWGCSPRRQTGTHTDSVWCEGNGLLRNTVYPQGMLLTIHPLLLSAVPVFYFLLLV